MGIVCKKHDWYVSPSSVAICCNCKLEVDAKTLANELDNRAAHLESLCREVVENAKPVYATARNTPSVRNRLEQGGYLKHYEVDRQAIDKLRGEVESGE